MDYIPTSHSKFRASSQFSVVRCAVVRLDYQSDHEHLKVETTRGVNWIRYRLSDLDSRFTMEASHSTEIDTSEVTPVRVHRGKRLDECET
ncbi:hypothetical protein A0H81_07674 [Grifola frondosa]|uniref:Uncharacterized protein n=1 Tax=Grifola frondosa TaxID=5627 RepID=A0A1C7M6J0_GRIFR|nr:hypothetical protein A0H81_07674 [Grifola frondosa]